MNHHDYQQLLVDSFDKLEEATKWLLRSYTRCRDILLDGEMTPEDFDAFETLTSRFARVSDMILQKVFRNIDTLELEDGGTLLDALNRAEKRGLIESTDQFREIRALRNEIAHEYALDDLTQLFADVITYTPALLEMTEQIKQYCRDKQYILAPE